MKDTSRIAPFATFKENGKFILELAKKYDETTWLFKPHPRFKFALLINNVMTEDDINKYYNEWLKIGRIYDKGNYFDIFKTSDLLITDSISFRAEYLPTLKPIICPTKHGSCKMNLLGKKIIELKNINKLKKSKWAFHTFLFFSA